MRSFKFKETKFYKMLHKDVKEFNSIILSLFCISVLVGAGLLSYKINDSYAIFTDVIKGEKTIEVTVHNPLTLLDGKAFNEKVGEIYDDSNGTYTLARVVFTDEVAPEGATTYDFSEKQNNSVVGWVTSSNNMYDLYISTQKEGVKVVGNKDSSYMFAGTIPDGTQKNYYQQLYTIDFTNFDASNIRDMSYMLYDFGYVASNINIDMSSLDLSNVINMEGMFKDLGQYSQSDRQINLSNLDLSKVTNMGNMFYNADGVVGDTNARAFILNMNGTDFSGATNITGMFGGDFHVYTININMSGAVFPSSTQEMFYKVTGYRGGVTMDLSNADTSNVKNMSSMFYGAGGMYDTTACPTNINVSNWNISNVVNMRYMFSKMRNLRPANINIVGLDTWNDFSDVIKSDITSVAGMFADIYTDNGTWTGWKTLIAGWGLSDSHITSMETL